MNFRRFSFVSDYAENEIDEGLKNLYPASSLIEERCAESVKDRQSLILANNSYRQNFSGTHYEKSFQQVLDHLPKAYYDPSFDPIVDHLEEISSWKEVEIIERFMTKIEDTDTDKDIIIGELTSMIDANYDDLMSCMRKTQEICYELKNASGTITCSRAKIFKARSFIQNGALRIKILSSRKQKLYSVLSALDNLRLIQSVNKHFTSAVLNGDLVGAAEVAISLCECMLNLNSNCLSSLINSRDSIKGNLNELRLLVDKNLNRLSCEKFSCHDYDRTVRTYLVLDLIFERYFPISVDENLVSIWDSGLGSLPKLTTHYQVLHLESSLRATAVECVYYAKHQKRRKYSEIKMSSHADFDLDDSPEIPLNVMYRKVPREHLPECIVKACEFAVEILRTNYLISRWHFTPFNAENADSLSKHSDIFVRLNSVPPVSSKSTGQLNSGNLINLDGVRSYLVTLNPKISDISSRAPLVETKFGDIYQKFEQYKSILWEEIARRLLVLLNLVSFGNDVKLDDFAKMMSAVQSCIEVGEFFSQGESKTLKEFIGAKATTFFTHYHAESFQMLKFMLESELWQSIPIGDNDQDNSLHSILKILAKDASKVDTQFSVSNDSSDPERDTIDGNIVGKTRKSSRIFSNLYSTDSIESNGSNLKKSRKPNVIVVTQSSLHGVAKHVFKYLDILTSMPVNPSEVIECMCQLFDFYICAVFFGFVSQEDQNRFLGNITKMNSPPPDHEKEFQVIKLFLEKSLNQRVSIKSFHDEDEGGKVGHSLEEAENLFDYVKLQSLLSIPLCIQQSNLSNFFGLKERMVAAESCHFVAQVLLEIKPLVPFISAEVGPKFDTVVDDYVYAAEQLRSLIYKFMSPSLINQNLNILSQIVEAAWDSRKPPERQHEWVDRLVANCKKVWDFVSTGKEFSEMIQEQIWLECCQASFDVTIEGFSKVRKCTAEGRAAMTLDLFALHEGLNKIHLCRPPRGKPYVDNYLRTFYLSEEEIMNWIQQNWQAYAYRHLHGLLQQTMSSMLNSKKLRDAIATVDSLYDVESTAISTMFTSRFKDENKFSNLITSKFRR